VTSRNFCYEIRYIVLQNTSMSISGDFETKYLSVLLYLFILLYDSVKQNSILTYAYL